MREQRCSQTSTHSEHEWLIDWGPGTDGESVRCPGLSIASASKAEAERHARQQKVQLPPPQPVFEFTGARYLLEVKFTDLHREPAPAPQMQGDDLAGYLELMNRRRIEPQYDLNARIWTNAGAARYLRALADTLEEDEA